MMTKNNNRNSDFLRHDPPPKVLARIDRLVNSNSTHVKAYASVNIGGAYAIHGVKVIDSQKGLFVQMPQTSYQKDGKMAYRDVAHPVTSDARSELTTKVLEAYQQKLSEDASQNVAQTGSDFHEVTEADPDDPFAGLDDNPPFDMGM